MIIWLNNWDNNHVDLSFSSSSNILNNKFIDFLHKNNNTECQQLLLWFLLLKTVQTDNLLNTMHPEFYMKYFKVAIVKPDHENHNDNLECFPNLFVFYICKKGR